MSPGWRREGGNPPGVLMLTRVDGLFLMVRVEELDESPSWRVRGGRDSCLDMPIRASTPAAAMEVVDELLPLPAWWLKLVSA